MPESDKQKPLQRAGSSGNAKFNEIQKQNLETVKNRPQVDDSDQEIVAKSNINDIFKNYQGCDSDVARITQFFESGDNVDCLICKKTMTLSTRLISSLFRHTRSKGERHDMELSRMFLVDAPSLHPKMGERLNASEENLS